MKDEVTALGAGFFRDIDGRSLAGLPACLKNGIVLGMDRLAWIEIVIRTSLDLIVGELPSGAATVNAVKLPGWNSVVSLTDDPVATYDNGPHLTAGAR
jgi:hypothetical protein